MHVRPGKTNSQVDPSSQFESICESVSPVSVFLLLFGGLILVTNCFHVKHLVGVHGQTRLLNRPALIYESVTAVAYSRTFFMHVQNLPGEMVSLRIVGVEEGLVSHDPSN